MRKLERPDAPPCLKMYTPADNWQTLSDQDKDSIWEHLDRMQYGLCAYCEREIPAVNRHRRHIEHFKPRSKYPKDAFEWVNLFGACNDDNFCARFKDSPKCPSYATEDLIKPDADSPREFLTFLSNGEVIPKKQISTDHQKRAQQTIDVLQLNHHTLIARRRRVYESNYSINKGESHGSIIDFLSGFLDESAAKEFPEIKSIILQELNALRQTACSASLRHAYQELLELYELRMLVTEA